MPEREACGIYEGAYVDGFRVHLEAAHTIGRAVQDEIVIGPRGGETLTVKPDSVVPLCQSCHEQFDSHRLDLLPYLSLDEQLDALRAAGGIVSAYERLTGERL